MYFLFVHEVQLNNVKQILSVHFILARRGAGDGAR